MRSRVKVIIIRGSLEMDEVIKDAGRVKRRTRRRIGHRVYVHRSVNREAHDRDLLT